MEYVNDSKATNVDARPARPGWLRRARGPDHGRRGQGRRFRAAAGRASGRAGGPWCCWAGPGS
ncbi:MAG: hypothetical protein MZV70_32825 [Desulfobacterales bacterium]|nr:hypothetical protein [Desulfobacterales bacterium]